MKRISPNDTLNQSIAHLEIKRDLEFKELNQQFDITFDSLKPINLIKDTFKQVSASPDLKNSIGKVTIGAASGYLVKSILFRNSSWNPLKLVVGLAVQTIATSFASKNSNKIIFTGQKFLHALLSKLKFNKNPNLGNEKLA